MSIKSRLSEKAMLVHLRICMWTGRQKDNSVKEDVCTRYESESDAGAWWTYLVPKAALDPVNAARMKCRTVYFKYTLPWMDGSLRILSSPMFLTYRKEMRRVIDEYNGQVEIFLGKLPNILKGAEKRLGNLMQDKPFPSIEEIRDKFAVHHNILPIPEAEDFRVDIGEAEAEEIRDEVRSSLSQMTANAMDDLWEQFSKLIGKIANTLKDPSKKFKNSLITNLDEFCQAMPNFNITNNEDIKTICQEAHDRLAGLDPDTLRKDRRRRSGAVRTARQIMTKLDDYRKNK